MITVYGLFDPETGELRYVGKTKRSLRERMMAHRSESRNYPLKNPYKSNWIKQLTCKGLKPEIDIIELLSEEACNEAEVFWIQYFTSIGCRLTNLSEGGDGGNLSRIPNGTDEQVLELYRKGLGSKKIAKILKTCAKRVSRVVGAKGLTKTAKKQVRDSIGNVFPSETEAARAHGISLGAVSAILKRKNRSTRSGIVFDYQETK